MFLAFPSHSKKPLLTLIPLQHFTCGNPIAIAKASPGHSKVLPYLYYMYSNLWGYLFRKNK